jgi:hypothetical protein
VVREDGAARAAGDRGGEGNGVANAKPEALTFVPSAGPRSTSTGSRTSATGASAASSGGATASRSGTTRTASGIASRTGPEESATAPEDRQADHAPGSRRARHWASSWLWPLATLGWPKQTED